MPLMIWWTRPNHKCYKRDSQLSSCPYTPICRPTITTTTGQTNTATDNVLLFCLHAHRSGSLRNSCAMGSISIFDGLWRTMPPWMWHQKQKMELSLWPIELHFVRDMFEIVKHAPRVTDDWHWFDSRLCKCVSIHKDLFLIMHSTFYTQV